MSASDGTVAQICCRCNMFIARFCRCCLEPLGLFLDCWFTYSCTGLASIYHHRQPATITTDNLLLSPPAQPSTIATTFNNLQATKTYSHVAEQCGCVENQEKEEGGRGVTREHHTVHNILDLGWSVKPPRYVTYYMEYRTEECHRDAKRRCRWYYTEDLHKGMEERHKRYGGRKHKRCQERGFDFFRRLCFVANLCFPRSLT